MQWELLDKECDSTFCCLKFYEEIALLIVQDQSYINNDRTDKGDLVVSRKISCDWLSVLAGCH